jgi:hypothetical protein
MHGSRSKFPSKKSRLYIYDVKFLALLGAPYIYDISRLRVNTPLIVALQKVTSFFSAVGVCGCDVNNYGNIVN